MPPSRNHAFVQAKLAHLFLVLDSYLVYSELSIEINDKEYRPDICLYPKTPINFLEDVAKMTELPLLAVEILSPSQPIQEALDKFKIYFAAGIKSCWLVLPSLNSVMVFSAHNQAKTWIEGDVIDETLGIRLPIKNIW